jgi:two-component system CheB/CheR fusion protein
MAKKTPADHSAAARKPKPSQPKSATGQNITGDLNNEKPIPPNSSTNRFPIVGVGASAGGLAALKEFFAHVPKDSGFAFVVIVHVAPEHKSHLPELLQPHVKIPVQQVTETTSLEPNRVYVIPPNFNLDSIDTHLPPSD